MEGEKKRSVDSETSGKERKKVKISEEDKQESSSVDKSLISEETPKVLFTKCYSLLHITVNHGHAYLPIIAYNYMSPCSVT